MSKFRKIFSDKEWNKCCGSFCKDCKIANAYRKEFGKKKAEAKFKKDSKKQKEKS